MAEIAAEVHIDSATKTFQEDPEICASNVNPEHASEIKCSKSKPEELSASNELQNLEFNTNSVQFETNIQQFENENVSGLLMILELDKTDDNGNYNFDNESQLPKTLNSYECGENKEPGSPQTEQGADICRKLLKNNNDMKPKGLLTKPANEILRIYSENEVLWSNDVEYSDGARDLIQRLLNPDPQKRLRSLLSLQNIRFFKDFNFAEIRMKKIAPADVLVKHFPNGPINNKYTSQITQDGFADFDTDFV